MGKRLTTKQLRDMVIKAEERDIEHIETFLESHPLDSDVNITVALELGNCIEDKQELVTMLKNVESKEEA